MIFVCFHQCHSIISKREKQDFFFAFFCTAPPGLVFGRKNRHAGNRMPESFVCFRESDLFGAPPDGVVQDPGIGFRFQNRLGMAGGQDAGTFGCACFFTAVCA